jgi:hypothetical protein
MVELKKELVEKNDSSLYSSVPSFFTPHNGIELECPDGKSQRMYLSFYYLFIDFNTLI